jgi:hypothetical protein
MIRLPLLATAALLAGCGTSDRSARDATGDTSTAQQTIPTDTAQIAQELVRLEREYVQVETTRDSTAATRLVAPDAIINNPDGTVQTGTQMVSDVSSGVLTFDSLSTDSLQVRVLGPTVALVAGRVRVRGRLKPPGGGAVQDIGGDYRFIDVWKQRGTQWQIVAEQVTRIGGQ